MHQIKYSGNGKCPPDMRSGKEWQVFYHVYVEANREDFLKKGGNAIFSPEKALNEARTMANKGYAPEIRRTIMQMGPAFGTRKVYHDILNLSGLEKALANEKKN